MLVPSNSDSIDSMKSPPFSPFSPFNFLSLLCSSNHCPTTASNCLKFSFMAFSCPPKSNRLSHDTASPIVKTPNNRMYSLNVAKHIRASFSSTTAFSPKYLFPATILSTTLKATSFSHCVM
ncbi:hypothetical protein V8G54_012035, partial [Vigna mungo]